MHVFMKKHMEIAARICLLALLLPPISNASCQFTDNGDGTVTNTETGLMWKKCSEGQSGSHCSNGIATNYSIEDAAKHLQAVNMTEGFAGHTDWRLPSSNEKDSVVDPQCSVLNQTAFPNAPSEIFWSADDEMAQTGNPLYRLFFNLAYGYWHDTPSYPVRLVRSGH